ncbi:Cof-type HAD-IIB family hydrolase [Enterococcus sp. BWT-B8]|uniref:Cof-type HAD-IIB family hydrolase n=1 Tax=Enterococcus sp. BWT-B8 TaxID=2885157 RepID=UPI001E4DCDDE|nr:Cof-type HAD-IIB family hydrolase [Enterococcus sp. BWT-B8]MCB5951588.1 Cof-type HAD-IIB family hydrolase [Enterococcus sp. BWT-B8]
MIKIIFFDIDGTLVDRRAKALDSTRKAISQAQSQGILCGVATGRSPIHLSEQIDALNFDVFVTYNGQLVYTKDETLYERTFSKAVLEQIVDFADTGNRQLMFGGRLKMEGSSLMRFGQNSKARKLVRFIPKWFPVAAAQNLLIKYRSVKEECRYHELNILNEEIYQCVLLSSAEEMEDLNRQLPDCTITRSNPYVVDIIPQGGSKLRGIMKCIETFGFSLNEVMTFGDNWNDVEMLEGTGIGVAMGNAPDGVKASADFVTATNEDHGIYQAMVHYKIIEEAVYENR